MNIVFAGFGVVGNNVARLLSKRKLELGGLDLRTVAIVDSGGAAILQDGLDLEEALEVKGRYDSISRWKPYGVQGLTTLDVLERVNVDLLIETTPTNVEDGEPGVSNIESALAKGIDVVTTNKGPIVLCLDRLTEASRRNDAKLRYSGTVGGGTPILDFARHQLNNERILSVEGILNATSNYVLWKMANARISLEEALEEARSQGITETDARYDISGLDTACKLVIIANSTMNVRVKLEDVEIKGIQDVSLEDVLDAERRNMALRLVGRIKDQITVLPELIKKTDHIYVEAENNSVRFSTEYGHYTLIGKGAGGRETANAVIRDLVSIVRSRALEDRTRAPLNQQGLVENICAG